MLDNEKKKELAQYIAAKTGKLTPGDQEAEIEKYAAMCPAATATDKGLVDNEDKAYEVMLIQKGQQQTPAATDTVKPVATLPTSGISAAEELNIVHTLLSQRTDRTTVSSNTTIDSLVLDRPAPADIIKPGTKGIINEKGWNTLMDKINAGTYTVKPDDGPEIAEDKRIASTTNFTALKAAFEAKQPVDVWVGALNTKPIGYIVKKGSVTGSTQKPVQMTRAKLERFMVMETAGYIIASETKPGAKLRYVRAKADAQNPGAVTQGKTILADANKKEAIKAGSYVVSKELTPNVESTNCKSALQFRVLVNGKFQRDGVTPLTRTVRVTLKADLPTLKRKDEFLDEFGTGERDSNAQMLTAPTGKQLDDIEEAQRNAIALLRQKALDPKHASSVADISDKLQAFNGAATQSPAAAVI